MKGRLSLVKLRPLSFVACKYISQLGAVGHGIETSAWPEIDTTSWALWSQSGHSGWTVTAGSRAGLEPLTYPCIYSTQNFQIRLQCSLFFSEKACGGLPRFLVFRSGLVHFSNRSY
jgi:hypothetical protein